MKIICIGRNYLDHAKELNNKLSKEPLFFLKPDTAIQPKGHPFFIPDFSKDNITDGETPPAPITKVFFFEELSTSFK